MNLFQVIVIGSLILILGGSGYYFIKADKYGVLSQSISGNRVDVISEKVSEVSGRYECSIDNGCQDSYVLNLNEDGTFDLTTTYSDGAEVLYEKGRWFISGKGKNITLNVNSNQTEIYEISKKLVFKSIDTNKLSNLVYSDTSYQDMTDPVFIKTQ